MKSRWSSLFKQITFSIRKLNHILLCHRSNSFPCHLMLTCMQSSFPGPLSDEPLGPQMANRLSFVFTVTLRTEGCDISQKDVCAHSSLTCFGEGKCHPSCCISDGCSLNIRTGSQHCTSSKVKSGLYSASMTEQRWNSWTPERNKRWMEKSIRNACLSLNLLLVFSVVKNVNLLLSALQLQKLVCNSLKIRTIVF